MKLTDCNGTVCALFSGQHFTTATVGKTSCCVILVVIAFLCIGQSAINPASLEHLGYEGDTIVWIRQMGHGTLNGQCQKS